MGIFTAFLDDADVRLYGFEAGGEGIDSGRHAARMAGGSPGVLHGTRTYVLQDEMGQTVPSHSISAGLDYPGVGPQHAWLHDTGRATYAPITDVEAMDAFALLCRTEGIIPAIESAHALAGAMKVGRELGTGRDAAGEPVRPRRQGRRHRGQVVRGRQRRGDRRVGDRRGRAASAGRVRGGLVTAPVSRLDDVLARTRAEGRAALVGYLPAGYPSVQGAIDAMVAMVRGGVDIVEVGLPYSDPLMDGPTIQQRRRGRAASAAPPPTTSSRPCAASPRPAPRRW